MSKNSVLETRTSDPVSHTLVFQKGVHIIKPITRALALVFLCLLVVFATWRVTMHAMRIEVTDTEIRATVFGFTDLYER